MFHASLLAVMHAGDALLTHAGATHLDGEGPIALIEAARPSCSRAVSACSTMLCELLIISRM